VKYSLLTEWHSDLWYMSDATNQVYFGRIACARGAFGNRGRGAGGGGRGGSADARGGGRGGGRGRGGF